MRLAAAVAIALFAFAPAFGTGSAAACEAPVHLTYNVPVELEGVLRSGTGHHEAQGAFDYVFLALDRPLCVDPPAGGGDEDFGDTGTETAVDRVQVANEDENEELTVGRRVLIKGKLFGAHTLWHAEKVLIGAESVEPK